MVRIKYPNGYTSTTEYEVQHQHLPLVSSELVTIIIEWNNVDLPTAFAGTLNIFKADFKESTGRLSLGEMLKSTKIRRERKWRP